MNTISNCLKRLVQSKIKLISLIKIAKAENLSSEKLNKIEEMKWIEMPDSLKLFAYDFCILNGFVFTGVGSK